MVLFRDMTQADHFEAAQRAYDQDEARYQRSIDGPDLDDPPDLEEEAFNRYAAERLAELDAEGGG